jgi:hypothetical protein
VSDLTRLRQGYFGNCMKKDIYMSLGKNISFPHLLSLSRLEKEFCSPFSLLHRPPSLPQSFPKTSSKSSYVLCKFSSRVYGVWKLGLGCCHYSSSQRDLLEIRVLVKEALGWNGDEQARIMVLRLQERTTRWYGLSKGSKWIKS